MRHVLYGILALTSLLSLPVGAALAQPNDAFQVLRDAERFAPGGVSIDNHRAEQLFALDEIAARGTPELERLFHEATTTEGKLYALLALYSVDRASYDRLSRRMPRGGRVRLESGCMQYTVDVDDALADIAGPLTMFPRRR